MEKTLAERGSKVIYSFGIVCAHLFLYALVLYVCVLVCVGALEQMTDGDQMTLSGMALNSLFNIGLSLVRNSTSSPGQLVSPLPSPVLGLQRPTTISGFLKVSIGG